MGCFITVDDLGAITPPGGEIVRVAFDAMLVGMPADSPATYTPGALHALRRESVRRGVPQPAATRLVRQEVWRRLLRPDPNPEGGLDELAFLLSQQVQPPAPPAPVIIYAPAPQPIHMRRAKRANDDESERRDRKKSVTERILSVFGLRRE